VADKIEQEWASMVRNLEMKSGRSLDEWVALARASGLTRHKELVGYLKAEQGLTHGYANMVASRALEQAQPAGAPGPDPVAAQYAGDKAGLRPIYDALAAAVSGFGDDVTLSPKKGYVSLRRSRQFGLIQPSTRSRVDVGINLREAEPAGRLERSGSFNEMVSHRVRLERAEDVDDELIAWLRRAYEQA
jgi:hypothetical protein